MDNYVKVILNEAPSDMDGVVLTPAADHLFDVNPDAESLNTAQGSRALPSSHDETSVLMQVGPS